MIIINRKVKKIVNHIKNIANKHLPQTKCLIIYCSA